MKRNMAVVVLFILLITPMVLNAQVLEWQGYWAGGYISGTPSDPWLVLQPTSAFNFQIINTSYSVIESFSLPIPGNAIYYNVIAAAPDFDTDNNTEVLYQYTDGTNYTGHVILRDITTSSNQLTFSDTDSSYYGYTFYFGNERLTIITGSYNSSTHAWLYRSNNPQSIDESNDGTAAGNPFLRIFPNPAVKYSEIHYSVPEEGEVTVSIHDVTGRKLKTIISATLPEGQYMIPWYGTDNTNTILPAGTYYCTVTVDGKQVSEKLILLK